LSRQRPKLVIVASYTFPLMLIVFNPAAGTARRRRLARAMDALREAGLRPEIRETRAPGDAERIACEAVGHFAAVIAAGGDGTIAEVAAGLAQGLLDGRGRGTALGILPFGTANVLAQEIALPLSSRGAALVLAGGRHRLLHTGVARGEDGRSRLFVQMVGAGFDAAVVHGLPPGLKRRLGRASYVLQSLREMARNPFPPIEGEADGIPFRAASAIVSKGRLYAGRFLLAPDASPFAPGFTLALFAHGGVGGALAAGAALPLDLLPRLPGLTLRRVSRVSLRGPGVALQADGDAAGFLPVSVEDGPAIPLLVPDALALAAAACSAARIREQGHAA